MIMSLYGTDIAANVRKDGSFEIDLVPGGLFTLMGSTSLDGYGTLLRRLQLRDGQDLVIPDTLSLPVTGLLAPANIWVESDTGTGDVRVRWNQVDHPNRMGYVLEKVENGVVTQSQFLTDTVWKDSLAAYWEGLPLLGPWPSREAVYRVSTRPLNGKVDSRSVAQTFVAKAPEWAKRVDSVKVHLENDSVRRVRTVRWNDIHHPDVVGWRVERIADGEVDCSKDASGETWSDVNCIDPSFHRDTASEGHDVWKKAITLVQFQVYPIRKNGVTHFSESTRITVLPPDGKNVVEWGDPESSTSWKMYKSVGDWIMRGNQRFEEISKDGLMWIPFPVGLVNPQIRAIQDSVWLIDVVGDSVRFFVMRNGGAWERHIAPVPTFLIPKQTDYVMYGGGLAFGIQGGMLAVWFKPSTTGISAEAQIFGDSGWQAVKWDYLKDLFARGNVISTAQGRCEIGIGMGAIIQCDAGDSDDALALFSNVGLLDDGTVAGAGSFFSYTTTPDVRNEQFLITRVNGLSYQTKGPEGTPKNPADYCWTLFRGRIWAIYDGKLWKGQINIPTAQPVVAKK
ncbi:MAG: hypothetical protein IPN71_20770 [Fibrobacteres bacterium]|nr:hypothetical protein [Fibrobacterota bacterium]